jgi:hypothetical protein
MQIIHYDRWDHRMFCPVTGQPVFDENMEPAVPTFRAFWVAEVMEEPTIASPELAEAWATYVARVDASQETDEEEWLDADQFLESVESTDLVAFRLTSHGIACGPISQTIWVVLDLGMEINEVA